MIGKLNRYGLPFSNVVAAGTATAQITPGRTIENMQLVLGGTFTKAMITLLRLKANGKTFFEGSGTQIDKLNAYRGVVANAAFLDCDFTEPKGKAYLDRVVGAFDTSIGIANITAEVTIAGATSPTLKSILKESAQQKSRDGSQAGHAPIMHKVLRYPFSVATGGTLPVVLPFGPQNGAVIKRVHFEHTGNMTGVTVKQDSLVIHESLLAENNFDQTRMGRVPQTNMYTVDFVLEGEMDKALDTRDARSMEWLPTFSAADSGYILVEYMDILGNL